MGWLAKRRAARADLEFRDGLASALEHCDLSQLPSPRRFYPLMMLRAMNWWIDSGRAGTLPPRTSLLPADAAPRDLILLEYVCTHAPPENVAAAVAAIEAQREHMRASFDPRAPSPARARAGARQTPTGET